MGRMVLKMRACIDKDSGSLGMQGVGDVIEHNNIVSQEFIEVGIIRCQNSAGNHNATEGCWGWTLGWL